MNFFRGYVVTEIHHTNAFDCWIPLNNTSPSLEGKIHISVETDFVSSYYIFLKKAVISLFLSPHQSRHFLLSHHAVFTC